MPALPGLIYGDFARPSLWRAAGPFGALLPDEGGSGVQFAVNLIRYGERGSDSLPHLKKMIYRDIGEAMGCGPKVWPEDFETTKSKAPEAENRGGL